jgi:hypothetical protein
MNEKKDGEKMSLSKIADLTFNPNILMLIPFIYRYLAIIYREGLAINHP